MPSTGPSDADLPAILGGDAWLGVGTATWPVADEAIAQALQHMAEDGSWGRYAGPHTERLTEALRRFYACRHVLLCSSGRAAIELALRGLAIHEGDEVALSAYDFHSNFAVIQQVSGTPLLCDIRPADVQLDVSQVAAARAPQTRCILASHLHGGLVDMPQLRRICNESGLSMIEDACQAAGATVAGQPAGTWGDVGVLSFGGSKLLSAGRGGALLTDRSDVMQRIRRYLRGDNHAYALSEMQAAVLLPQLDILPVHHQQRQRSVFSLDEALNSVAGLRRFAAPPSGWSPAFYKVGLVYDAEAFDGLSREAFCSALRAEGLPVDPGFPALHTIHSSRRLRAADELTHAEAAGRQVIGLHHPILLNESINWSELPRIVERIRAHSGRIAKSIDTQLDGQA